MLTEPLQKSLDFFIFQSSELDQNVDLDATKTMVWIKTGIESQKHVILKILENSKIRKTLKTLKNKKNWKSQNNVKKK